MAQGPGELAIPGMGLSRDRKTLLEFDPASGLRAPNDVTGVDDGADGAQLADGSMVPCEVVPNDMVPDMKPPLPIDPPMRAMAGPVTDTAARQPIATARRGIDLFTVKSFRGSPGNACRFPSGQRGMDRFAEVLGPDCCSLLVLADIVGVDGRRRRPRTGSSRTQEDDHGQ